MIQSLVARLETRQRDYEDLLTRLKLSNPEYASQISVAPLTLAEVQKLLEPDTTLLSFFVTEDKTLAYLVKRDSFETVELPVAEKDLRTAITAFRDFANLNDSPPSLNQLYDWLIAPLRDRLTTPLVGIIPHGPLHYLPFAALGNGQYYLGADHALFYLPSASVLPFIQQKRNSGSVGPLVVAQSQAEGFPALRFADTEAQEIATLYDAQPLLGDAATEAALKRRASNHGMLHIAAHGELNQASPLFSRIVLKPEDDSDGSLEVHEVYGLDLRETELVVLSACETFLGSQSRGDDIVGLNRAFIYAGAPTVITSLWAVDDQATTELMTSFYTHLKEGMSKAQALRMAQEEVRSKPGYAHPYYWAAFVLTGDPGPVAVVQQPPALNIWLVAVLVFGIVGAAGTLLWLRRRSGGG